MVIFINSQLYYLSIVTIHDELYPSICNACGIRYYPVLGDNCPNCGHDNDHETNLKWLRAKHDLFRVGKIYGGRCVFCDKLVYGAGMRLDGNYSHIHCLNISKELFDKRVGPHGVWVR